MRRLLAVIAGSALLAACGTTVPLSSQSAFTNGSSGLGVGQPTPTASLATEGTSTGGNSAALTPGDGAPGGLPSTTTGTDGSTATQPGGGQTSGSQPLLPGGARVGPSGTAKGVTATTIKIGVFTAQGFGSFAASAGFSAGTGDQNREAQASIDYINAHGGLAGRKIIPVFHDESVAGAGSNVDNEYTSACAAWTQDNRVYAVVSPVGTVDSVLYDCLSKAGVPTIAAGDSQDASFFQKYGSYYYQPTDMNLRRIMSNLAEGLSDAGFFGAKPEIGVILGDNANEHAAVDKGLVPALARHGLKLADSVAVPTESNGASAYSSAVLRFQAEGITHVLFTYLGSPLLFMVNAENQQYHPRYGLHSRTSPGTSLQANAPAKQQHGAMGIGWQPINDVDAAHDPGVISPRQKLCLTLLKNSGQAGQGRIAALLALWMCDNFFFLQDALAKAPDFTMAGLRAGAESLGSFGSASTFRSTMAPGRLHDGAGAYRIFAFKDDCTCYQYVSPLKTAS